MQHEGSGEAWEGLGWAGYWLHDAELTLRSRERAYQAYRGSGDCRVRAAWRPGWPPTTSSSAATTPSPVAGWSARIACSTACPPAPTTAGWPSIEGSFGSVLEAISSR